MATPRTLIVPLIALSFASAVFPQAALDPGDVQVSTPRGPIILSDVVVQPGNPPTFKTDIDNKTDTEWRNLSVSISAEGTCQGHSVPLKFHATIRKFVPFGASDGSVEITSLGSTFVKGCVFQKLLSVSLAGGDPLSTMDAKIAETLREEYEKSDPAISAARQRTVQNDGPFGFRRGMSKNDAIKLVGRGAIERETDDLLVLKTAPRPHPAFFEYALFFTPLDGMLKLAALGEPVDTNGFGAELRQEFLRLVKDISITYGVPTTYDYLKAGSIWNEPRDWMTGLMKKERVLDVFWKPAPASRIIAVEIEAFAVSSDLGHVTLTYEFDGWSKYVESKREKQAGVF
jgi:hypothetical protein